MGDVPPHWATYFTVNDTTRPRAWRRSRRPGLRPADGHPERRPLLRHRLAAGRDVLRHQVREVSQHDSARRPNPCDVRLRSWLLLTPLAGPRRPPLLQARRRAQLPIHRDGSKVIVHAPSGPVTFEADDFPPDRPRWRPLAEWPARRGTRPIPGSDAILASAWWALENGLTLEATATLRDLQASDPKHEPTATLVRILDAITPPLPDPDLSSLTSALSGTFRTASSPHFLLLHQGNDIDADVRLDVLERVYTSFYLTFAGQGMALADLVKSSSRRSSQSSPTTSLPPAQGAGAFATTQGYYHPRAGSSSPSTLTTCPRSANAPNRSAQAATPLRLSLLLDLDSPRHRPRHGRPRERPTSSSPPRDSPRRHDAFPTWLHEGLAAQFETIRGGRWAGVGRRQRPRLPDWRSLRPTPAWPPSPATKVSATATAATSTPRRGLSSISSASPTPPSSPATSTSSAPPPTDDAVDTRSLDLSEPASAADLSIGGRMAPLPADGLDPLESDPMPLEPIRTARLTAVAPRRIEFDSVACTGRSSAWLECTVRDREVGGSNPLAPTEYWKTTYGDPRIPPGNAVQRYLCRVPGGFRMPEKRPAAVLARSRPGCFFVQFGKKQGPA